VLLGLQAVVELGLGTMFLFNFKSTLERSFGITYSNELDVLGFALGLYLLLLTTLIVLSMAWELKGNTGGAILGIVIGVFLFVFC
jgi:hypothetical protein